MWIMYDVKRASMLLISQLNRLKYSIVTIELNNSQIDPVLWFEIESNRNENKNRITKRNINGNTNKMWMKWRKNRRKRRIISLEESPNTHSEWVNCVNVTNEYSIFNNMRTYICSLYKRYLSCLVCFGSIGDSHNAW